MRTLASAGTAWAAGRCCSSSRSCSTSTSARLRTWVSTWREAGQKREEVATLRAENEQAARPPRRRCRRHSALEREARRLGMVKAGERAYIVEGLPKPAR